MHGFQHLLRMLLPTLERLTAVPQSDKLVTRVRGRPNVWAFATGALVNGDDGRVGQHIARVEEADLVDRMAAKKMKRKTTLVGGITGSLRPSVPKQRVVRRVMVFSSVSMLYRMPS